MKKKRIRRICVVFAVVLAAAVLGCVYYVNDYYRSEEIIEEYLAGSEGVTVVRTEDSVFFNGSGVDDALIFYPGAKVEFTAYAPLLKSLAEQGIDCFLLKMPCNLAILGADKAGDVMAAHEYERWYLAGHSLGGAMAASFAADHLAELDGLALFAAYPTKSLEADDFAVVSVYGSQDLVLNQENFEAGRQWMPEEYTEVCIQGGNHAQFGRYGFQKGDGQAMISPEAQVEQAVEAVLDMMK